MACATRGGCACNDERRQGYPTEGRMTELWKTEGKQRAREEG